MQNKVKITIAGKEYALQSQESPEYVMSLASKLDKKLDDIVSSSDNISILDAAMLISLSSLDEINKLNENVDNIRTQIKDYIDEAGKARLERDRALKENLQLKLEIQQLENELNLKKLKDKI